MPGAFGGVAKSAPSSASRVPVAAIAVGASVAGAAVLALAGFSTWVCIRRRRQASAAAQNAMDKLVAKSGSKGAGGDGGDVLLLVRPSHVPSDSSSTTEPVDRSVLKCIWCT